MSAPISKNITELFVEIQNDIKNWMNTSMNTGLFSLKHTVRETETEKVLIITHMCFYGPNCLILDFNGCTLAMPPEKSLIEWKNPLKSAYRWTGPTPTCTLEIEANEELSQKLRQVITDLGIKITEDRPFNHGTKVLGGQNIAPAKILK